jgi:hypothetical protein
MQAHLSHQRSAVTTQRVGYGQLVTTHAVGIYQLRDKILLELSSGTDTGGAWRACASGRPFAICLNWARISE